MSSSSRRVVITGIGLVSPLGCTKESLWDALSAGQSGVRPFQRINAESLPSSYGAEALDFAGKIDDFGPLDKKLKRNIKKGLKVMCREIEMGVAVAQMALVDANLVQGEYDIDRTGVIYGCDYIMTEAWEFNEGMQACIGEDGKFEFDRWAEEGLPKVTPLWLLKYLPNMPACHIAIYNDLRGPNNSITIREASPNLALGEAYCTIVRGSADRIITGATGTRIQQLRTIHLSLQEKMADADCSPGKASRPFDLNRSGQVFGEGAGALILEELESAQARGATILAEVVGFGSSAVGDRSGPNCSQAVKNSLEMTLGNSGLSIDDVGHLHAHGLSCKDLDIEEARAINEVFADRKNPLPIVAAKANMGNLGAGGGMVEVISSIMALQNKKLFPAINCDSPDPECSITLAGADSDPGESFINVNVSPQGQAGAVAIRAFA